MTAFPAWLTPMAATLTRTFAGIRLLAVRGGCGIGGADPGPVMTSKRKEPSPLVEAAQAFDEALEEYARAGDLFVRGSISTTKQLERANELLGQIAATEARLAERGAALAAAINVAHTRQQAAAQEITDRLPALQDRNEQLKALLDRFQALGAETGALNASAASTRPAELVPTIAALADRAGALASDARSAGFEELAREAHSLHQRLTSTAKKLQSVAPS